MNHDKPSKLAPVLAGGAFLGVTSALPVIGALNCACCLLVVGGGFLSTYLYLRDYPGHLPPATSADGALLGLLSGVSGSFIYTILTALIGLDAGDIRALVERLQSNPDVPPELIDILEKVQGTGAIGGGVIFAVLLFSLVVFSIFAMVGGILGIAVLQKKPPQAPPQQWSQQQPPGSYIPPSPPAPTATPAEPGPTPPEKKDPPEDA